METPQLDPIFDKDSRIAAQLEEIYDRLNDLETREMTPADVGRLCTFNSQTIASGFDTMIQFDFTSGCSSDLGLGIEQGDGSFENYDGVLIDAIPDESFMLIYGSVTWASNATGLREVFWRSEDGSSRNFNLRAVSGRETRHGMLHYRSAIIGADKYGLGVHQDSGGDLSLTSAVFAVFRFR